MRTMRIWRADDESLYARDDKTGEEFWFAPYHSAVDSSIARTAISYLLQDQLNDFVTWLQEGSVGPVVPSLLHAQTLQ